MPRIESWNPFQPLVRGINPVPVTSSSLQKQAASGRFRRPLRRRIINPLIYQSGICCYRLTIVYQPIQGSAR